MTSNHPTVWPVLSYRDARAPVEFREQGLRLRGACLLRAGRRPLHCRHAETRWPLGGGVMFGTAGKDDSPFGRRQPGNDSVYVVCDDPDALLERAVAAGADVVRGLVDEDYGSRGRSTLTNTSGPEQSAPRGP